MLRLKLNGEKVLWQPRQLIVAGYTGRDQESTRKHVDELKKIGIPSPHSVPMIYEVSPALLTTASHISAVRQDSSGEAEFVLINVDHEWYVGLGSDHTDRRLEKESVQKSKQVCSKPIADEIWPLKDCSAHWDDLQLKSWITEKNVRSVYQEGTLNALMTPDQILNMLAERGYDLTDTAVFCGTLPIKNEQFIFADSFSAQLYDPDRQKSIHLNYKIQFLKDAEEI